MGGDDIFYNGFKLSEFGTAYGLEKLGVGRVGPFFARGVLLDVAGVREERSLPAGYVITVADLQKALDNARATIKPGDAVLINTGHGFWWMTDNKKFADGEPGIGLAAAKWLTKKKVSMVGSDNWALEVVPSEDPDRPFACHQLLLVRNGTYILENLDLSELAKDKVYQFAFVFAPLRLKGDWLPRQSDRDSLDRVSWDSTIPPVPANALVAWVIPEFGTKRCSVGKHLLEPITARRETLRRRSINSAQ